MTKKQKMELDNIIAQAEKIVSVKTIQEAIDYMIDPIRKRLVGGHLHVNGYYTFKDSKGLKTLIFWEA